MPDPVVLWSSQFTVNAGNTAGTQQLAVPLGLSDGTFIIAWVDDTNNVDNQPGTDIIGQHYDALGNPLGGPVQLNHFGMLAQETDPYLAALSDGRFVMAYEQNTNLGDTDILYEVFDSNLQSVDEGVVALGAAGADQVRNPTVIVYPSTDFYQFTWQQTSVGDTDIFSWSPFGGVPVFPSAQNGADFDRNPDTAAFAGGVFITVYEEDDAGTTSIEFHIRNASTVFISQGQVATEGSDPHVAVINDTDAVITWTTPTGGIFAEIRDRDGNIVRNNFPIANVAGDFETASDVVALQDGGFFVVWYDTVDDRIEGRRFDGDGNQVGNQVTIANGAGLARPDASVLADGRVIVSWDDGGDIGAVIVDPRDSPIFGDALDNILTGRPDGGNIIGYSGDDQIFGGAGDDLVIGGLGADYMDGGGGDHDVLSYVNSLQAVSVNLGNGHASGGEAEGDAFINFEIVYGSGHDDSLVGNNGGNELQGFGGNDVIRGRSGADILDGGVGFDTVSYQGSSAGVTVNLNTGAVQGGDADGDQIAAFEAIRGSQRDDRLTGDGGTNTIKGMGGEDILRGLNGSDRLFGNGGQDRLDGGSNIDRLTGGGAADTFVLTPDQADRDLIFDFQPGSDVLEINAAGFGGNLQPGALPPGRFQANLTGLAEDNNDRFIYRTDTGELFFDSNGADPGGERLIATFLNLAALSSTDFVIV
ncbi:MAG TPA: calcium-binding protein [Aestuariivirga sp.]|nr:calcium-binding protein [Aestuariivirga sp.]